MAKKYKRSASAQPAPSSLETSPAGAPAPERPAAMFARRGGVADFNPDYSYISKDLKRIGILTTGFVVILFALSFILPMIQR